MVSPSRREIRTVKPIMTRECKQNVEYAVAFSSQHQNDKLLRKYITVTLRLQSETKATSSTPATIWVHEAERNRAEYIRVIVPGLEVSLQYQQPPRKPQTRGIKRSGSSDPFLFTQTYLDFTKKRHLQ
jgi:hypothetical protein